MPGRVCVVGSINMDLVVRAPRLPAPGETIIGAEFQQHPGGKGANQAVAARRSGGADVVLIGAVGDDAHGRTMLDVLSADGIDVEHVEMRPDTATGVALITVDAQGENTIVVASGANATITSEQMLRSQKSIESAEVTLAVLEAPVAAIAAAAEVAVSASRKFVLNAAPAMHLPASLLRNVSVLVANQTEAAVVCDHTGADLGTVTRALLALGPQAVIVTLGAGGALIDDARGMRRIPAIDVSPIDTVGAGDCFAGALAARLAAGEDLDDSARFACTAAGLATTRPGAVPGMPTLAEVQARSRPLQPPAH